MSNVYSVSKGDNSPDRHVKLTGVDIINSTCLQAVREDYDTAPVISETVTATINVDGVDYHHAYLTPAQTDMLEAGKEYFWIVQVSSPTNDPPRKKERPIVLKIKKQGIA